VFGSLFVLNKALLKKHCYIIVVFLFKFAHVSCRIKWWGLLGWQTAEFWCIR
jgi:hypothetical protein